MIRIICLCTLLAAGAGAASEEAKAGANDASSDHPFTEGVVVNVARIRTVDGRFDDYMKWIGTTWKQQEEASKKAGNIVSYQVMQVEPRGPDDADLLLVVTYRNWAALDNSLAKEDVIEKQMSGSLAAANQAQADRSKLRRILGSSTMRVLDLK